MRAAQDAAVELARQFGVGRIGGAAGHLVLAVGADGALADPFVVRGHLGHEIVPSGSVASVWLNLVEEFSGVRSAAESAAMPAPVQVSPPAVLKLARNFTNETLA